MHRDGRPRPAPAVAHCSTAEPYIPALAGDDGHEVPAPVRRHVEVCLRCQAEAARYHRLVRQLRTLQADRVEPPEGALHHTLSALHDLPDRRPPAAYVGGVVATAAGAAGVGVLVWRSRRRALAG